MHSGKMCIPYSLILVLLKETVRLFDEIKLRSWSGILYILLFGTTVQLFPNLLIVLPAISSLPQNIAFLKNLRRLVLYKNRITELPEVILLCV